MQLQALPAELPQRLQHCSKFSPSPSAESVLRVQKTKRKYPVVTLKGPLRLPFGNSALGIPGCTARSCQTLRARSGPWAGPGPWPSAASRTGSASRQSIPLSCSLEGCPHFVELKTGGVTFFPCFLAIQVQTQKGGRIGGLARSGGAPGVPRRGSKPQTSPTTKELPEPNIPVSIGMKRLDTGWGCVIFGVGTCLCFQRPTGNHPISEGFRYETRRETTLAPRSPWTDRWIPPGRHGAAALPLHAAQALPQTRESRVPLSGLDWWVGDLELNSWFS